MKADSTMRRHEKALRELVETDPDPVVQRVAYAMETALRWARLDTAGWPTPPVDAVEIARYLRKDLGLPLNGGASE